MLQTIRDHTQGWLAGTIVSVLILMFALWGISAYFTGSTAGAVVAKVNGVAITKEHFALSYEQARRQLQSQLGSNSPLTAKQEVGLKDRVLKELISTEALKQASLANHYHISSLQIDSYLQSIPEFQDNGQFSLKKFQDVMASSLYSASDLLDLIKTTLLIAQPKLGVILTSVAFPDETQYTIALVNQERSFNYLNLSAASLVNQKPVTVTQDQIAAYYKTHQDEFKTPEQVSIDYVELSLKNVIASLHPSPEMLKNYYNENINNFTQPGQWKLQFVLVPVADKTNKQQVTDAENKAKDLLQKIHQGQAFEKFAQQFTDASLQSDLSGWVSVNQLPAALQKPVLALSKANPISGLIVTDLGFMILKMTDIQETQVQPFAQVKDKVMETMTRQQGEEKLAAIRDQLADLTYEHPDSLQPAATALDLTVKSSVMFTLDKGGQDISANKKVRDAAFGGDVLSSRNNSDVIQINPETFIVLRIKSHLPPALLPLNAVSKQIQDRLQAEQTQALIAQMANEIYQKLQQGAQESQIAQNYKLNWAPVGFIGRYSNKVASAVLDKAFQLPRPQDKNGNGFGIVQLPNGYAVIALHAVRDAVIKDQKQYALFAEQIQNSEGLLEYELYRQSIMQKAKVVIENQV